MTQTAQSTASLSDLTGDYTIDATHSQMGFVARHAMVTKVRGTFNEFEGTVTGGASVADAAIAVTIQAASVDTRNSDRDAHLVAGDFFDVDSYPTIEFVSTRVEPVDEQTLRIAGDLTIKGVTRPVSVDFAYAGSATDPFGMQRVGFEGSTTVRRSDFGMTFNAALETGGVLVSDAIVLEIEISAVKNA
ncbi:MAG TPA: YceI family protein [Ornithinimicrobium sp.]|uniref:YceI family protein n=1 Tax=Ornithinimicrobium sp. TaxID=1977084 RepID=UPI002B48C7F6|nr:YceI family protein [Ornithinimicrobium sp.]HKJ10832.1 YceI family protein [Ornithinimicrobium sp.]